jgi:hypothetical protein
MNGKTRKEIKNAQKRKYRLTRRDQGKVRGRYKIQPEYQGESH